MRSRTISIINVKRIDQANVFLKTDSVVERDKMFRALIRDLVIAEKTLLADIAHNLDENKLSEAGHLILRDTA